MTDDRDPELTARNAAKVPVDDPPICERHGCGHYIGIHTYNSASNTHGWCTAFRGCHCPTPLYPGGGRL